MCVCVCVRKICHQRRRQPPRARRTKENVATFQGSSRGSSSIPTHTHTYIESARRHTDTVIHTDTLIHRRTHAHISRRISFALDLNIKRVRTPLPLCPLRAYVCVCVCYISLSRHGNLRSLLYSAADGAAVEPAVAAYRGLHFSLVVVKAKGSCRAPPTANF